MEHKLFKVNQNAVITDQSGKILILKNNLGWGLPGGRLEDDVSWQEGLSREIFEETGITGVENIKVVHVNMSGSKETYMTYFTCSTPGAPIVKLSDEHAEFAWIEKEVLDSFEFT